MNNLLNNRYLTLIIKVTHKCNLQCPYCYDWKFKSHLKDMDFDLIKEILKKQGKGVIRNWTWHGGEPMIKGIEFYEKQNQIIKEFDEGIEIQMQTNGTLVNEKWIEHFKKWNVGVGFSFDGLNNDNTRGHTQQIIDNINLMKKHGLDTGQILVITDDNVLNLVEEYEYQKSLKLKQQWNIIFEQDGNENTYNLSGEKLFEGYKRFFEYYIHDTNNPIYSYTVDYFTGLLLNTGNFKCDQYHCAGKWMQIDTYGNVYPCGRDWKPDMKYGNVFLINDFKDLYKSDQFKQFLTGSMKILNHCRKCKWFYQCHGGCYQNQYNYYGINFEKPEPNYCYFISHLFEWLYDFIHNEIDWEHPEKYNPYFLTTLYKQGFRPEKLITKYIKIEKDGE